MDTLVHVCVEAEIYQQYFKVFFFIILAEIYINYILKNRIDTDKCMNTECSVITFKLDVNLIVISRFFNIHGRGVK